MSGLFQTLSIGLSGLTTQQTALNTTSHNISNASTAGYSRQTTIIQANDPLSAIGLNSPTGAGQIGTGSQATSIQRVRDSFIDYQVRNYTTLQSANTATEKYISEVQGIFNEPTDTGISTLMSNFFTSWSTLASSPADTTARTNVATAASTLADQLNSTSTQLQSVKTNINTEIQSDVLSTNGILDQIDTLNKQIMTVKFSGSEPNDLMDQRDNLLDSLSTKLGITIDKKAFYGEDVTPVVQTDAAGPADTTLVATTNTTSVKRFSYITDPIDVTSATDTSTPPITTYTATINYYKNGDISDVANKASFNVTLSSDSTTRAQQLKTIEENRVLWAGKDGTATSDSIPTGTDTTIAAGSTIDYSQLQLLKPVSGELTGYTQAQQDIDTYSAKLDNLAKILAFSVNAIESGVTTSGPNTAVVATGAPQVQDNMPFFVNSDTASYDSSTNSLNNLGAVLTDEQNITAANISVNKYIINNVNEIKTRTNDNEFASEKDNTTDANGDGKRAQLVADLQNSLMDIANVGSGATQIKSRADLFTTGIGGNTLNGITFQNNSNGTTLDTYFKDTVAAVATAEQTASRNVTNQQTLLDSFNQQKQSVSGVSLDEEMANMVQFQHAYQANAKVISTVDTLLDVVINDLKKS